MLTTKQSKLVKLAEEASEVAKEALKAAHFPGRVHEGETPEQRLRSEILDLLICIRTLQYYSVIEPIEEEHIVKHWREKLPKIRKYTRIAVELGTLQQYEVPTLFGGNPE